MKPQVIILIGPPLSGKDTYLKNNKIDGHTVISRDDIMMSFGEKKDYLETFWSVDQKKVNKKLNEEITNVVSKKNNVILNMTNLTRKSRNKHLSKFTKDYERIAIVFPKLDISEYITRNEKRKLEENKFIPVEVIKSMIENWDDVSDDEGFDKIINL